MAMGKEDWGNCNGALGQEQQEQQEAMAVGQWGTRSINRISIVLQRRRRSQLQWHWGTGAGATEQCCNGNGATIYRVVLLYVVLQRKTSTIVVDETVQNVWTANIPDVLRWNKTCMICSGIVFGVSELYSKVELVNAFRINSSLKWSKINSNRVSNIISECSQGE
jgi:hypothetical protein